MNLWDTPIPVDVISSTDGGTLNASDADAATFTPFFPVLTAYILDGSLSVVIPRIVV